MSDISSVEGAICAIKPMPTVPAEGNPKKPAEWSLERRRGDSPGGVSKGDEPMEEGGDMRGIEESIIPTPGPICVGVEPPETRVNAEGNPKGLRSHVASMPRGML